MDREEKLFWLLISIAGIWASVLVGLILNRDLGSVYGQRTLLEATLIGIAVGGVVFLVFLLWPQAQKPIVREVTPPQTQPQPELTIPISELKSTGEVKEIEVRFPNGDTVRKNRVCFYYVTVRTKGQRTVENVFASLDGNPLNIAPRTEKPSFGVDYDRFSVERFDERGPLEFVFALLSERRKVKDRIRYLHPGPGQDFALFFGVEGLNDFYIFAGTYVWYDPRRGFCGVQRDDGTGILKLRLHLEGQDAKSCNMMFKVNFRKWDSFSVTPVELPQQLWSCSHPSMIALSPIVRMRQSRVLYPLRRSPFKYASRMWCSDVPSISFRTMLATCHSIVAWLRCASRKSLMRVV